MGVNLGTMIRQARKNKGMTLAQVGEALGVTYAAVQQWESGKVTPRPDNLSSLGALLDISADILLNYSAHDDYLQSTVEKKYNDIPRAIERAAKASDAFYGSALIRPTGSQEVSHISNLLPAKEDVPRDVPVLGAAVGGEDADFSFNGETVDFLRRPIGLAHARRAYAIYVMNDSMWPRYEDGDVVFVNPDRRALPGDDVIIEFHDVSDGVNGKALLKRLIKTTATMLIVEQFNPRLELRIDREEVKAVHRVVPPRELLGL